ncbi:hypothetical protein DOJK_01854 [Patescibacteria group bacterium]|nr:hypothetical protein DOJK_01854 [Patescibacteria group bacterium]
MPNFYVFDTYAKSAKGKIIHFDVILEEQNQQKAMEYAQTWLDSMGINDATINSNNCFFCHSVQELPIELAAEISDRGYAIYKLEGCPK